MKLFAYTIKPLSAFGTPLKGDTLFGHFCWQAKHDPALLKLDLDACIKRYNEKPFVIFSSALIKLKNGQTPWAAPRPTLPAHYLFTDNDSRLKRVLVAKENKIKKWILIGSDLWLRITDENLLPESTLAEMVFSKKNGNEENRTLKVNASRTHNTINRCTNTTGSGMFAPYESDFIAYRPGLSLALLVLLDENVTDADRVGKALERIGKVGYGRDASTGLGRFTVTEAQSLSPPEWGSAKALYTLGPAVFDKDRFSEVFSQPFIRFGRHGDYLAHSRNPFKNPVIMADDAAVCVASKPMDGFPGYVGRAVSGISKSMPTAVAQGYSLCLPITLPDLLTRSLS